MDVMVSRCWPLDCCIASLFKLRTSFPGIASPLHLAGIGQRRNWMRSGIRFSPSRSQTRRQADGKCWEAPPGPGPPDCALRPTAAPSPPPDSWRQVCKGGSYSGQQPPRKSHSTPHGLAVAAGSGQIFSSPSQTVHPAQCFSMNGSWPSDHPTLPLRLQFLPLLCNALMSVINSFIP